MTSDSLKSRKKDLQRQEILNSAREVFMKEGHAKTSMRKLAKSAGCAPGTLYLYFKDKDHIVSLLIEESFERLMTELEAQPPTDDPLLVLRRIMETYVAFGLDNPDHYQVAFMVQRNQKMDGHRLAPHRSFAHMRTAVASCVEKGVFRTIDPELATQGIWTNLHGITSTMITMPNFPWVEKDQVIGHILDCSITALLQSTEPYSKNNGECCAD